MKSNAKLVCLYPAITLAACKRNPAPHAQQQNAALKKLIMGVARNSPGVSKTNIGGWQSDVHFFERTEVPVTILRTRAYHAVFRYLQVHLFQPPQITFCGP